MKLRGLARLKQQVKRMNEVDRVVARHLDPTKPETFYATSGSSTIERADGRWMPHDHKPVVGFTPNEKAR